jgi:ubiquinone biosynthesis protein
MRFLRSLLARELGPLGRLGVTLTPHALAEASVAVVIPVREKGSVGRDGVFKILKPGIEERLEQELALIERVGAYLDEKCEELGIPRLDYQETFEALADKLRQEVRLDLEQRHLAIAHSHLSEPRVQSPALFDFCSPRVTAMERMCGQKIMQIVIGGVTLDCERIASGIS